MPKKGRETSPFQRKAVGAPDRGGPANLERRVGVGIAILVPSFGVIGLTAMLSDEGADSLAAVVVSLIVFVSTIPVACWWWFRSALTTRMPGWFVIYADIGVAVTLLTFSSIDLALYATALFAVIGTYIAYFSRRRILQIHSVFVDVFICGLGVTVALGGEHDVASTIARVLISLLVVNSVLVFRAVIKRQLELANTDWLTGLLNRRGFEIRLERSLSTLESDRGLALLVVDLDRFKTVNDTHGHSIGDAVLGLVATRLAEVAAGFDGFAARTGGEEFTLAAVVDGSDVLEVAERVRVVLNNSADDVPVTVSVGATLLTSADASVESVGSLRREIHTALMSADSAMYHAKRAGGNRSAVVRDRSGPDEDQVRSP